MLVGRRRGSKRHEHISQCFIVHTIRERPAPFAELEKRSRHRLVVIRLCLTRSAHIFQLHSQLVCERLETHESLPFLSCVPQVFHERKHDFRAPRTRAESWFALGTHDWVILKEAQQSST